MSDSDISSFLDSQAQVLQQNMGMIRQYGKPGFEDEKQANLLRMVTTCGVAINRVYGETKKRKLDGHELGKTMTFVVNMLRGIEKLEVAHAGDLHHTGDLCWMINNAALLIPGYIKNDSLQFVWQAQHRHYFTTDRIEAFKERDRVIAEIDRLNIVPEFAGPYRRMFEAMASLTACHGLH